MAWQSVGLSEELVRFRSGDSDCVGFLTLPARNLPLPAVVLCTGFSGTQDTPSIRAAAEAFALAGFASLTFDYRGFGHSDGDPRQIVDLAAQRTDITAALQFLQDDDRIDSNRIALWGTSLGGAHVVVVASETPTVAAVISQVPFNGFPRKVAGRSRWSTTRLLLAMLHDRIRGALNLSPRYIRAVGSRGSLAVMASDDAAQTIRVLDGETWRNEVAPRVLFDMMSYRPDVAASKVSAPLLVCLARKDLESPESSARRIADNAPQSVLKTYPISHFEVYRPEIREQVLSDQIEFLLGVM